MMTIRISTSVVAALILWTLTATVPAAWAGTVCQPQPEEGAWKNIDAPTPGSITWVTIRAHCYDYEGCEGCPFYMYTVGMRSACHPTDCFWGGAGSRQMDGRIYMSSQNPPGIWSDGWLTLYASDVGLDYLRVVVRHRYPSRPLGLIFDGWFLRAELVGEPIPLDPADVEIPVKPEGSQLAR